MFSQEIKWDLLWFVAILLNQQGAIGLFVKHLQTGKCIDDSGLIQSKSPQWGHLTFLKFSDNCLKETAQFRFRDNGALLNLEADGCFAAFEKYYKGSYLPRMFYIYVDAFSKDRSGCAQRSDKRIYRAITQTSSEALSSYTPVSSGIWCAFPGEHDDVSETGIKPYLGLNRCNDAGNQRFIFGSVTCHGAMVKNANCPKDQYMVVKTASYRGLSDTKTCNSSNDYRCEVDATCVVKKQCDGKHECNITVANKLFPRDPCPGWKKYLYFEYRCINTVTSFDKPCVESISLSSSQSPHKGFLTVSINNEKKIVCSSAPNAQTMNIVCRQLGYQKTQGNSPVVSNSKLKKLNGSIDCNGDETTLSQCVTTNDASNTCSEQSFVTCAVCDDPLLEYTDYFPDSSFNAHASSQGHHPSMARISSGSSWCAPKSGHNHYLEVDLRSSFAITDVATFGDSTRGKWVTSYNLNYTVNMKEWKQASTDNQKIFRGNKNAYNYAAIRQVDITARAVRFIPLNSVDQACMRVQMCGKSVLPGRPSNLTVGTITPNSAESSWSDPVIKTTESVSRFWVKLERNNDLIRNLTTKSSNENKYFINHLTPFTQYKISVALGNVNGFGELTSVMFTSGEDVPDGPPLKITVVAKSSSSLSVTWNEPEKGTRNGIIVDYTVCISHEENKACFKEYTTSAKMSVIGNLNVSTKYYIRVLASTKIGRGMYSNSIKKFTYAEPIEKAINETTRTLTFSLRKPTVNFTYFYVLALKLPDGETPKSPDIYTNTDLLTYDEASGADGKVYIASVFTSGFAGDYLFVLGDGTNTSNPSTTRRRRSTAIHYYNGPLEAGTSYRISQRIFIGKGEYYSTDWSPASKTRPSAVTKASGGNNVGTIVGAVVGIFLVLIIIVIVAVIIYKRRTIMGGSRENGKTSNIQDGQGEHTYNVAFEAGGDETIGDEDLNHQYASISDCEKTNSYANTDNVVYGNQETIIARSHLPIPVAEFDGYLSRMKENKNKELVLDFEDLPIGQTKNWSIAKRSFNTAKNRFGNAVTYDRSRVVLSGDEKEDYINASFIDGATEKYYIATQGPKPKTVNDFWRMIFEYQCPTIVMLTTLKEMGKVKCEKYWPDECDTYGKIKVTVKESKAFADYVTRRFLVEKDDHQLEVQHLHFVSWPDFGVPLYPTQILTFRRQFRSYHETTTGPAVIHCSAGVGRTGVFIAMDKMLHDLDKEKTDTIDIFGLVKGMRTRRVNMVQTSEQYVFLHDTILDHIKCGVNEIEAAQVMIEIRQLSEKNKNGKTGFDEKFQRLRSVSPKLTKEQCEAALLPENRNKNRKPEIYPSDSGRVYLKPLENNHNSDYINACYVDGHLGRNYFIATQVPLKETIDDFWRMVLQLKSSTIVVLNQLREKGKEYPMFWPTERAKPQSFGATSVMVDSFIKKEDIVVRKFIVSPSPKIKDGRMVRMIHYMSWPDHGVPKNVDDIVKILSEVEDSQRAVEGKKGPVIVMCSDGAGRGGTYIAISNLVDRMKVLQAVDVFQCIKLIRSKRPQFVETVAQFKLCYLAITSVLKSFDEYSNFEITDK